MRRVLTAGTFAAIYIILARVLHLNLILTRTLAAGGDMGSHHYVAEFLRQDLLPRGKLSGWAPGWYGGIPMLEFYFPLPYVLIAALSPLLGYDIAFKVITVLGLFLLPLTSWGAFRILRLPEPAPLLAAAASVPFLLMTSFTIYGGNIASTMAGEFPFALSFALLPLALALLYRAVEEGKGWRVTGLVVAAIVLSHILTTIVLVFAVPILFFRAPLGAALRSVTRVAKALLLAFCLSAFWGLPFIAYVKYTAHFKWTQIPTPWSKHETYDTLFPAEIRVYLLLAAAGLVLAVVRGERPVLLFAWPGVISMLLFMVLATFAPMAPLWNARLLPFMYLCFLLIAAYGASELVRWVVGMLHSDTRMPAKATYIGIIAIMVLSTVYASYQRRATPSSWAQYNYEGYEAKPGWPDAQALFVALRDLPEGRIMWEFSDDYERFGTTRTLENIPIFTNHPTMEGLLIESSLNAPFHFINQAETSVRQTDAVPGLNYPSFDFPMGLRHLRMFGVRWFVAYTDQTKQAAKNAGLKLTKTVPQRKQGASFNIYEIGDGHLVEVPQYRPVLATDRDWRLTALDWYRNAPLLDTPLVFTGGGDKVARKHFADPGKLPRKGLPATLPREPLNRPGTIADAHMVGNDELDFTTDRVGEPHIVKVSWFPNWKVEGAEGPWMLSPGLMVVVPTQAHVRLVYRDTPVDLAGKGLSVAGIAALGLPAVGWVRRRRRPAGAEGE